MKITRYILLFVGTAGLSTVFFGLVNGDAFSEHLMNIVCAASLIYGYFTIHKTDKAEN